MLFEPIRIRAVEARNRLVVSPMCQYSAEDGRVTDWHLVHLGKFAQGGAGIVFMEATAVEARGRITHGDTGIWDDGQVAGLSRITSFLKDQGAVPAIQLAHAGRKASMQRPWYGHGPLNAEDVRRGDRPWGIVAPTARAMDEASLKPQPLSVSDLQQILSSYRKAVKRAFDAGFEIVEIHAAHGYLLHTFLSPLSNDRTDQYGGSLENRMRFPLEVVAAVREAWPADRPLFFRCSSIDDVEGGWSVEDTVLLAKKLKQAGVDVVDCSSGGIVGSVTVPTRTILPRVPGFQIPFADKVRKETGMMTMAVGLILTPEQAEEALKAGSADLIAVGREMLYDPNWPLHAARALGVDAEYALWPKQYGWWLTRRESALRKAGVKR